MEISSLPRAETPFHLTIRFTSGSEDLNLDIPSPSHTNTLQVKRLIRSSVPEAIASKRLRLIYQGRILQDAQILSSVLKAPPPLPRSTDRKGKAPELPPPRIYINCSIGDTLTPKELEEESKTARIPSPLTTVLPPSSQTAPQPRGFDRYLSAGLTPQEIAQLRAEFLARHTAGYTPDTMPSPTSLRRMEDEWIDLGADEAAAGGGGGNSQVEGELDDFFWGTMMGFLWPVGMIGWGGREQADGGLGTQGRARPEWLWSERRKVAVWTGVVIALGFGIVREIS